MDKKIIIAIIIILIIISGIVAVVFLQSNNTNTLNTNEQNTNRESSNINNQNLQVIENENKNMDNNTEVTVRSAVIYFSATGTTKNVAETISKATDSDIIEIIPKEKYTSEDLSYNNDNCRANQEQNDENARPEIQNTIKVNDYDIIYLGYPIWWGTAPKIILSLLDSYNFNGKTVIPFCTSGSTGISQSESDLKKYNSNINWLEGRRFNSSVTEDEITKWIEELEL